jgi:NAD-dependent SIR2 family protein deacetylase
MARRNPKKCTECGQKYWSDASDEQRADHAREHPWLHGSTGHDLEVCRACGHPRVVWKGNEYKIVIDASR